jgi:hypothetical protein
MMSDLRTILERGVGGATPPPDGFERMLRRRDRKRRNQRITAGVVGIAVFVAAVWIVTSGLSLDRTHSPIAPGPAETGAQPDVVEQGWCDAGARSRLALTDLGDRIRVRFVVYRSPVGHEWRITLRHRGFLFDHSPRVFFRGTRVANDNGVLAVTPRTSDRPEPREFQAKAVDTQTGQVCRARGTIWGG